MNIRKILAAPLVKALTLSLTRLDPEGIYGRQGYKELYRLLGAGGLSEAGINVSADNALQNSVVWACVRVVSETLACLPLVLMKETNGSKEPAKDHPLYRIMHDEPNPDMSDMEMREALQAHLLIRGNCYSKKAKRSSSGELLGLFPLNPDSIEDKRTKEGSLYYEAVKDGQTIEYSPTEILHVRGLGFDGVRGYSVINYGRNSIGLSAVQEKYVSQYFAKGGRRPYILEYPTKMKDTEFETFQARWKAAYGNVDRMHEAPITEGGLKYTELGFSPRDAQFLEGRAFSVGEICRWFRVNPTFVQDLTHATFSNIEHLAIQFVQHTMMPWCVRWEKALNRSLLSEKEKSQGYYFKHTMNALLRGDFASRMTGFSTAIQNSIMSPDECRDLEDMNPIPNGAGKAYRMQLNMQTLPGTGEPTAAERAMLERSNSSRGGNNGTQAS